MKDKSVYIHIGSHKTGTTYIQNMLYANRLKLEKYGIYYPEILAGHPFHHLILQPLKLPSNNDFVWESSGEPLCFDKNDFVERINNHPCDKVIISSELFFQSVPIFEKIPIDIDNKINYIKEVFSGFDVKFILYLRDPIDYITSCFSEAVTGSHTCYDGTMYKFVSDFGLELINYRRQVSEWTARLNEKQLIIRSYEQAKMKGGIVNDFLSLISKDRIHLCEIDHVDIKNISYDNLWLEYISAFNRINKSRPEGSKYICPILIEEILSTDGGRPYLSNELINKELLNLVHDSRNLILQLTGYHCSENQNDYACSDSSIFWEFLVNKNINDAQYLNHIDFKYNEIKNAYKVNKKLLEEKINDNAEILHEYDNLINEISTLKSNQSSIKYLLLSTCKEIFRKLGYVKNEN